MTTATSDSKLSREKRQRIRHAVRFFYDVQGLRIQSGNRSTSHGEENEPELDEDDMAFLSVQSNGLEALEAKALDEVKRLIKHVPIYKTWLKNQAGCGPTMSGVILSEVDITKCETVSQLWAYCGLAVDLDGRAQRRIKGQKSGFNPWLKSKMVSVLADCILKAGGAQEKRRRVEAVKKTLGENYLESEPYVTLLKERFPEKTASELVKSGKPVVTNEFLMAVMDQHNITLPNLGGWVGFYEQYKHRKASMRVDTCMNCKGSGEYTEKAKGIKGGKRGEEGKTPGKAMKCQNCQGTGGPAPWGCSPAHRNMAAKRYMIKMFLLELWKKWRELEGLPIPPSYAEVYLGLQHGTHGPNQEMIDEARRRHEERLRARVERLEKENALLKAQAVLRELPEGPEQQQHAVETTVQMNASLEKEKQERTSKRSRKTTNGKAS